MSRPTQVLAVTPAARTFRQSYTPLACHTPACGIRTHKQTQYSQSGPPVTTQISHACYSFHHPSDTRPLACLVQVCMNLAHAAKRCSPRPATLPSSLLILREHPRDRNRITSGGCNRTIVAHIRPLVEPTLAAPATQPISASSQAIEHALNAFPLLHLHPPH